MGKCWSYFKSNGKWNDINQVLQKEKQVSLSENLNELSISDVCCSDTIHLAVTYNGIYLLQHFTSYILSYITF